MLLKAYLITTGISWLSLGVVTVGVIERIKREGYKIVNKKESIYERIISFLSIMIKLSVPVLNLFIAVSAILKFDEMYEALVPKLIEEGTILPKQEEHSITNEIENYESIKEEKEEKVEFKHSSNKYESKIKDDYVKKDINPSDIYEVPYNYYPYYEDESNDMGSQGPVLRRK